MLPNQLVSKYDVQKKTNLAVESVSIIIVILCKKVRREHSSKLPFLVYR